MTVLTIDLETYSSADLKKGGVYRYASASDFEIMLIGYAVGDDPADVIDLTAGQPIPPWLMEALFDPLVLKTAFNANFERTCLARHFGREMPPKQWACTSVHALTLGLPGNLDGVCKALNLPTDKAKMATGAALIRYFCLPCKGTAANGGRTRNLPTHAPDKWQAMIEYCRRDVDAERTVRQKLARFPVTEEEQRLWELDQRINDYGIRVDRTLVKHAIACDTAYSARLVDEAVSLTQLDNPQSVAQLKAWLLEADGLEVESLSKKSIPDLLTQTEDDTVKRVLELRQAMSKTSVKKYAAMRSAVCPDSRIRGLLQFYGASRTGRWAGRLVQVQNLPQNKLNDLALARQLLRDGDYESLELWFGNVPDVLSQLIRTAFIPDDGCRFIVADFSAIEARVLAWLAGEQWRLDVFAGHGKIYETSASAMFGVPIAEIGKGSPLRQKGKIAELALGYQGGVGALTTMGALSMGLKEEELPELVGAWRTANPAIVRLWRDTEDAAMEAVGSKTTVPFRKGMEMAYDAGMLFIRLPSGRRLAYTRPSIVTDARYNKAAISYEGINAAKQWGPVATYGGKLVENMVQAIARDCLAAALIRADEADYKTVIHVHDELVVEAPHGFGSVDHLAELLGQPISWAPGLLLRADGYETDFYKKD